MLPDISYSQLLSQNDAPKGFCYLTLFLLCFYNYACCFVMQCAMQFRQQAQKEKQSLQ